MKSLSLSLIGVLVMIAILVGSSSVTSAGEKRNLRVKGTVIAVNVQDTPNTIVVKTFTAAKEELIVGVTVHPEVEITRGKKPTTLESIDLGEEVVLVYSKTPEGLVGHSVQIR